MISNGRARFSRSRIIGLYQFRFAISRQFEGLQRRHYIISVIAVPLGATATYMPYRKGHHYHLIISPLTSNLYAHLSLRYFSPRLIA